MGLCVAGTAADAHDAGVAWGLYVAGTAADAHDAGVAWRFVEQGLRLMLMMLAWLGALRSRDGG